ncbi:hypothetical protein [Dialister succinatiphilus]|jgi:hypothetical protein|uniref:hypothetical protein n=1 Tax=Dialister succinatiphilus TaxID=487173 RepID=UPI00235549D1|nr:hypothetical protein [Dialister succinatiphilus]
MKRILLIFLTAFVLLLGAAPAEAEELSFDEIYSGYSADGLTFSDKTLSLEGGTVTVSGYMAPPLTPTIHFFVLTEVPMSVCPFCSSDADWPDNIIVVKVDDPITALPYDTPITVTGTLGIGSETDEETGFVSQLRVHADSIDS